MKTPAAYMTMTIHPATRAKGEERPRTQLKATR
jgi:hypothetical protein